MSNKKQVSDEIRVRLTYYRKKKGLTQNEVADAIGMARSTYSYYEAKAVRFPPDFLNKVAKVLDVSPNIFDVETRIDNSISLITLSDKKSEYKDVEFVPSQREKIVINLFRSLPPDIQEQFMSNLFKECKKYLDID